MGLNYPLKCTHDGAELPIILGLNTKMRGQNYLVKCTLKRNAQSDMNRFIKNYKPDLEIPFGRETPIRITKYQPVGPINTQGKSM